MTYHRPSHSRTIKPPVDVVGLSTAIIRAPNRWGVLASVREIEAMAETIQMLWEVAIAAQAFELAIVACDEAEGDDLVARIANLPAARERLDAALHQIRNCQKQED
jgi:histidinol-phosphate/aromatic aminotransferase/cobyric acid decarboxylase-like protein